MLDLEGRLARRSPGLDPVDWQTLRAWFSGDGSRSSDADEVRHLATSAMRALLTNLRRISTSTDRELSAAISSSTTGSSVCTNA